MGEVRFGSDRLKKLPLATRFYLTLLAPLFVISVVVTLVTYRGLKSNASDLDAALRIQAKSNTVLALQLTQDDASKALLIDPSQLEIFSEKKIKAYDEHKRILAELESEASAPQIHDLLLQLSQIDEKELRPLDSKILEILFDDVGKARAMYFTDYEPHRKKYEGLVRQLAAAGSALADQETAKLQEKNLICLLQITLALILGVVVVAATIRILAGQVERSEENTKSLLAVLNEGLVFFNKTGELANERSQALRTILPGSEAIHTIASLVTTYSAVSEENVKTCLDLLWRPAEDDFFSDFDSTMSFLPKQVHLDDRTIAFEYRPLNNSQGNLEKVVVVATDVTAKLKNEREATVQAERVRKMSKISGSQDSYLSFFEEAVGILKRADQTVLRGAPTPTDLAELKRDLHTLKGSVGTFEFTSLASEIHELESILNEKGVGAAFKASWERIKDQWKFETSDIDQVLGLKENRGRLSMARTKFERLVRHAASSKDTRLEALLTDALRYQVKDVFNKYDSYLSKLTERRTEKQVRVLYAPDSSEISYSEAQALDAAFLHIFRNCFDHGIEEQDARLQAGKPSVGTIHLAFYRKDDGDLHFIIKDDGQGVNADKLAQKAVKGGHWTAAKAASASAQEKVELVFVANLSTKDSVSELSGRGVGMDAVKALVERLGGTISIFSQPGQGTQFEIDVKAAATKEAVVPQLIAV